MGGTDRLVTPDLAAKSWEKSPDDGLTYYVPSLQSGCGTFPTDGTTGWDAARRFKIFHLNRINAERQRQMPNQKSAMFAVISEVETIVRPLPAVGDQTCQSRMETACSPRLGRTAVIVAPESIAQQSTAGPIGTGQRSNSNAAGPRANNIRIEKEPEFIGDTRPALEHGTFTNSSLTRPPHSRRDGGRCPDVFVSFPALKTCRSSKRYPGFQVLCPSLIPEARQFLAMNNKKPPF